MLYGTRKELNKRLKTAFGDTEKFALLVWTREAVMAQAQDMTEQEADRILALIGKTGGGDHTETGISYETVRELLVDTRIQAAKVSVRADMLTRVLLIAQQALMAAENEAWEAGREVPAAVASGLNDVSGLKYYMAGSERHE